MSRLADKVIIVTGGARGIGAEFSEALAGAGAKVVIADIMDAAPLVGRISDAGGTANYVPTNVASPDSVTALVSETMRKFERVDAIVNNAAMFANLDKKPFTDIDSNEWDQVMSINVRGSFECAKAVAPIMIRQKSGKIINIASGTVFKGMSGMLHYVASKGAVVAMTRCLARELGPHNICVNAIAPGLTMSEGVLANPTWHGAATEATVSSRAIQREQMPSDLIGALLFFCSGDSDFVTGQTLLVDGGSVMR